MKVTYESPSDKTLQMFAAHFRATNRRVTTPSDIFLTPKPSPADEADKPATQPSSKPDTSK